jgi:hypothetical protein
MNVLHNDKSWINSVIWKRWWVIGNCSDGKTWTLALQVDSPPWQCIIKNSLVLSKNSITKMDHLPYSHDLAPCDFWLYARYSWKLFWRLFLAIAALSHEVYSFTRRAFQSRQQSLVHRYADFAFTRPFQELNCHTMYTHPYCCLGKLSVYSKQKVTWDGTSRYDVVLLQMTAGCSPCTVRAWSMSGKNSCCHMTMVSHDAAMLHVFSRQQVNSSFTLDPHNHFMRHGSNSK